MKKKIYRYLAFFMVLNLLFEVVSPTVALALTEGPFQPEFGGFEPANSSEMVDLFTGDFKYNIPLMDVDGYPLNLAYHAGTNMESEASWVGLGWSMNPGVLNRAVKGLPDDFNGDTLKSETRMKPHESMGVGFQTSAWFGFNLKWKIVGAGATLGVSAAVVLSYNNYKGYGVDLQMDGSASLSGNVGPASGFVSGGVGMSISSQDGVSLSYQHAIGYELLGHAASIGEGRSINTRTGAMVDTYFGNQSAVLETGSARVSLGKTTVHTIPAGPISYSPRLVADYINSGREASFKEGLWGCVNIPLLGLNLQGGVLVGFNGFYDLTQIAVPYKASKSYGYLYLENSNDPRAVMDFNRFKDGAMMPEVPNGPMANKTYDNYFATAQGMGEGFRPFRSDVGIVHDAYNVSLGANLNTAREFSGLVFLHLLQDVTVVINNGYSGNWNTFINNNLNFQDKDVTQAADQFYEKAYFKKFGELTARDASYDASLGDESPITPALVSSGDDGFAATPPAAGFQGNTRAQRDIRSTNIGYLTAKQADSYGFEKTLSYYDMAVTGHTVNAATHMVSTATTNISRLTKNMPANHDVSSHISEITLTNTSGSKYIYGMPAYNLYQKKVMFNASDRIEGPYLLTGFPSTSYTQSPMLRSNTNQMVVYTPSVDISVNNHRGEDNLYQADVTPAYASAYLLTNILSPDYVDVNQDGPTYDDLGSFTKFNYCQPGNFHWRNPYCIPQSNSANSSGTSGFGTAGTCTVSAGNHANLDKGLIADKLDDKAFYEYGIKENYYLQSIETKNYVAFFECSLRDDYHEAIDETGTPNNTAVAYKLDRIKLYSKGEIVAKGMAAAIPIKIANFVYNYSLCPKTFNSQASTFGKLTLQKVYFTYGSSLKSSLSPYEFYYGDNNQDGSTDPYGNPDYNTKATDRWGTYKPNATGSGVSNDETPDVGVNGFLNNTEFPYSEQNDTLSAQYASAWNLSKIVTPTSSTIQVTYEADDYGYVQDQTAGQMLMIKNTQVIPNPLAYVDGLPPNTDLFNANYLIVDLSKLNVGIPTSVPFISYDASVTNNLFVPGKDLYFKCFMKLGGPANSWGLTSTYYDFVPGYGTIMSSGLFDGSIPGNTYTVNGTPYYKYAYVRLKQEVAYKSTLVSPMSLAAWEYMRSFLPRIAYPGSEPQNMGDPSHKPFKMFANILVGLGTALADFVAGVAKDPNARFYIRNFCKEMDYSKSFVRAYVPYKKKKGGGHRVKQLLTRDAWYEMTNNTSTGDTEQGMAYGQKFDYTTVDVDGVTPISSGVAYYEPLVGGDEISLRSPIKYEITKKMAPNDHLFQETPYGEMFYPMANVGYSKVTVTPLSIASPTFANLYGIGKSVFEFYTAKDYPIVDTRSALNKQLYQNPIIQNFTVVDKAYKILHATQGHVLKFNDMHGKLKAINTYGQDNTGAPISGASYFYKDTAANATGGRQLITSALTMSELNVIATEQIARDIDVTVDNRSNINETTTQGTDFVLEISLCSPLVNVTTNLISGYEKFGLRTCMTTKIVQQYGILEKSEVFDNKSRTLSQNLLWDRNTGDVVLSKTTNDQDQPVYNFNYPAYWMYPRMGNEFKREGIVIKAPAGSTWNRVSGTLDKTTLSSPVLQLAAGDEVAVYEANSPIINAKRYWVTKDYSSSFTNTLVGTDYNYVLVDAGGTVLNTTSTPALSTSNPHYIKVLKPADRNQMDESAGRVSALSTPSLGGSAFTVTQQVISASAQQWCDGWNAYLLTPTTQVSQLNNCLYPTYNNTTTAVTRFNPYTAGAMGNWRPSQSFAYNVNRSYSSSQPNIKSDGTYSSYAFHWTFTSPQWYTNVGSPGNWVSTNINTTYSPYGYLMENMDAIGVYHARRYGFNHTLPVLSASNAQVRQVGFESFEEYQNYYPAINTCNLTGANQLDFYNQINGGGQPATTTTVTAHTGRNSLYFSGTQSLTLTHYINQSPSPFPGVAQDPSHNEGGLLCSSDPALNKLNITPGHYIVSFWVKGASPASSYASNLSFNVQGKNGTGTVTVISGSPKVSGIINGWQKFDYDFTVISVPAYASNSSVTFNFSTSSPFYLDDFRVQPFNSVMTCLVYDPNQLRVWAQLDDNNYATIMEYDNEGLLVRKKKETLKGIYTLQENRHSTVKRN